MAGDDLQNDSPPDVAVEMTGEGKQAEEVIVAEDICPEVCHVSHRLRT